MSIEHCEKCDTDVDTDLNAEHFDDSEEFREMAVSACIDLELPEDEAELMVEDYLLL